jgi:DNA-binding MarR family transcriptional regulator
MPESKMLSIITVQLDPLLHSRVRLVAMICLAGGAAMAFAELAKNTHTTNGNLSIQLKKLEAVGYIFITKGFTNSYPVTHCSITAKGKAALAEYKYNLNLLMNRV